MRTALLTGVAMVAFAANSLLCRLTLGPELIDAATFTTVRVISGAVTLGLILMLRRRPTEQVKADRRTAAMLFTYMVCFSFAYLSLTAGTGALVLWRAFLLISWGGFALASIGLIYLVSPGVTAPYPLGRRTDGRRGNRLGLLFTVGSGGEGSASRHGQELPLLGAACPDRQPLLYGSVQRVVRRTGPCGGFRRDRFGMRLCHLVRRTSGLTATRAATVQLSVPIIAAFGGVVLISEEVTLRLLVASAATLGGVAIVLAQRAAKQSSS